MNLLTFLSHINLYGEIEVSVNEQLRNQHTSSKGPQESGEAVSVQVQTHFIDPDSEVPFPSGVSCRFWQLNLLKEEGLLSESNFLPGEAEESQYWNGLLQAKTYSQKFGSSLKLEKVGINSVVYWFDLLLLFEDKYLTCLSPDLENIIKSKSTNEDSYTIADESYNVPKLRKFYTINCPYKTKKLSNLNEISKKMERDHLKTYEHPSDNLIPRRRSTKATVLSF